MKAFFKGIREAATALTDAVETHSPAVKAKLSELAHEAKTHASTAQKVIEEQSKVAKEKGREALASERVQGMVASASEGLNSVKNRIHTATATPRTPSTQGESTQPADDEQSKITDAIGKLSQRDKVGTSAEVLATAGGAAAGVAVAGTVASAAGAATLLGSTGLASLFGGVFVAATPIGWVIGSAVIAGAAGYGLTRMMRSGSNEDRNRREIIERLSKRLDVLKESSEEKSSLVELGQLIAVNFSCNLITEDQGRRMLNLVEKGQLNPKLAIERLKTMALAAGVIEKINPFDSLPVK